MWMAEIRELVEGEPFTPFARVATGADFVSPFANSGDQGLGYIKGSFMTGDMKWFWIGSVMVVVGLAVGLAGLLRPNKRRV
jgi:hypothetical protein